MNKSRNMRWAGYVALIGEGRDADRVLVGRPDGKKRLGRRRLRWEGNIKVKLQVV